MGGGKGGITATEELPNRRRERGMWWEERSCQGGG